MKLLGVHTASYKTDAFIIFLLFYFLKHDKEKVVTLSFKQTHKNKNH